MDNNTLFEFRTFEFTNDPFQVACTGKMVTVNGAIEVALTGQVAADSIGSSFYSGIGRRQARHRPALAREGRHRLAHRALEGRRRFHGRHVRAQHAMLKVFHKSSCEMRSSLADGVFHLELLFGQESLSADGAPRAEAIAVGAGVG